MTPESQMVKAVGNLKAAIKQHFKLWGKEELDVIKQMDDILNSRMSQMPSNSWDALSSNSQDAKNAIPVPRAPIMPLQPRVAVPQPRVSVPLTGEITKHSTPMEPVPKIKSCCKLKARVAVDHPPNQNPTKEWTDCLIKVHSNNIIWRQMQGANTWLCRSPWMRIEMTCEVFDEETGKQLKYRQLITHPMYCKIWKHKVSEVGLRVLTQFISSINTRYQVIDWGCNICKLCCRVPNKAEAHWTG